MSKRVLTQYEEQVIRLVHHDFQGLDRFQAAAELDVSKNAIDKALQRIKRKAPQLFPILTLQQKCVYNLLMEGCTRRAIAIARNSTEKQVDNIIQQLHKKGFDVHQPRKTVSYEPWMDSEIKEKF